MWYGTFQYEIAQNIPELNQLPIQMYMITRKHEQKDIRCIPTH